MSVNLDQYPIADINDLYETSDLRNGHRFSYKEIETFLQWGDDQDLHGGTVEELQAYDEEYNVTDIFPHLQVSAEQISNDQSAAEHTQPDSTMMDEEDNLYRRIVPGAQLFATAVHSADPIDRIEEVSFEEPVYENERVWLEHDAGEETSTYVFQKEDAVTGESVETGKMKVHHADDGYNELFATLVPIGMGQWDRTGDVLLGFNDIEAHASLNELSGELVFDGRPDLDTDLDGVQTHERRFIDEETVLSYQETDLHLD